MKLAVPFSAILIAIGIHALWGGNTVGAKFSFIAFGPMWSGFIRFALGVIVVICFARYRRISIWPQTHEWKHIVIVGFLFTLQIATMNIGIDLTTASMSSILISTNPLFAGLFAHFLLPGDRITPIRALGYTLAFAGVVMVISGGSREPGAASGTDAGNLICIGSACLLGLRLVISAKSLRHVNELRLAIWQMLVSLPIFAVLGFSTESVEWDLIDWRVVTGLLYQGIVVAGLGFATTFWLIKKYKPSVMMSFNFVAPVVGVFLGVVLLGDRVTAWLLMGVATVGFGLVLVSKKS